MGLSGAASAADLPVPVEEVPFVPTVEAFSWTGPYVGLNLGYAFGREDDVGLFDDDNGGFQGDVGTLEPDGVFGGVQLGYNFQVDRFVGGVETDFQFSSQEDDLEFDNFDDGDGDGAVYSGRANSDQDYFGTLRLRAGVAFDRVLVYGTGGLAYGNREYTLEVQETGDGGDGVDIDADEEFDFGYVIGAGAEFAFTDNLSGKAEYQFIDFEDEEFAEEGDFGTDPSVSFHTVRVGVNYKFNGLFQ
jgi:outer membrane immunogenic protein